MRPRVAHLRGRRYSSPCVEPVYEQSSASPVRCLRCRRPEVHGHRGGERASNGGAVIAINHTGYLDFTYAGTARVRTPKRYVRFMAKKEVFDNKISGPIMRGAQAHPGRPWGRRRLLPRSLSITCARANWSVCTPRPPSAAASRSRSSSRARPGWRSRPVCRSSRPSIWGAQRVWTKGHPKRLGRTNTPISIVVGEPIAPFDRPSAMTEAAARSTMERDAPRGAGRLSPRAGRLLGAAPLGGSAPTLEEATAEDERVAEEAGARQGTRADRARKARTAATVAFRHNDGVSSQRPSLVATDVDGTLIDNPSRCPTAPGLPCMPSSTPVRPLFWPRGVRRDGSRRSSSSSGSRRSRCARTVPCSTTVRPIACSAPRRWPTSRGSPRWPLAVLPGCGLAAERVGASAHDAATPQFVSSPGLRTCLAQPGQHRTRRARSVRRARGQTADPARRSDEP